MLKTIYGKFTVFEGILVGFLLVAMTVIVFLSAIMRYIGAPLIWATDISTLFFAWEVFIGGDILIRKTSMGGVELVANYLPSKFQKALKLTWFVMIIAFCAILVFFGTKLCLSNVKRLFSSLKMSYAWCTLAVPVGSLLMIISSAIKISQIVNTPAEFWKQKKSRV